MKKILQLKNIVLTSVATLLILNSSAFAEFNNSRKGGGRPRCIPGLEIVKLAPPKAEAEQFFSYLIRIRNTGNCTIEEITLRDKLPSEVKFISAEPPAAQKPLVGTTGGEVKWTNINLDSGNSAVFEIKVQTVDCPQRSFSNLACADSVVLSESECDRATTHIASEI